MSTHLAVAIVAETPAQALELARSLPPDVSLVEYRLDLMDVVDVDYLARHSPQTAIFTCRSQEQGGGFRGSDRERQEILKQALATPHLVDIEMTDLPAMRPFISDPARVIGSWHDFAGMLGDWGSRGARLRDLGAGIVKLVGMATTTDDVLLPSVWLSWQRDAGIAIAMGAAGLATRLLAPRFANAFLTFASVKHASAPGQIDVQEMLTKYGFSHIAKASPLLVMLTPHPVPWETVEHYRRTLKKRFQRGHPWLLPVPVTTLHVGLALALKLARTTGIIRLPAVATSPQLSAYGLQSEAVAWRFERNSQPKALIRATTTNDIMDFLLQGN